MCNIEKIWESNDTVFVRTTKTFRADDGTFRKEDVMVEMPKYRIVVIRENNGLDTVTRKLERIPGLEMLDRPGHRRQLVGAMAEQWVVTVSSGTRCGRGLARWSTGYSKDQGQWVK